MSPITDEEITAALRQAVPEPPSAPARLANVRRRAHNRRRAQLSGGSLALAAVVTGAVVLVNNTGAGPGPNPGAAASVQPVEDGLPAALHRPLHLTPVAAGAPCPVSPSSTYPKGDGFSNDYAAVGTGPVTLTGPATVGVDFTPAANDSYAGTGWPGSKVIWRISDSYSGPVLVRGERLDGAGQLRFDHYLNSVGEDTLGPDGAYPELGYPGDGTNFVRTEPNALRVQSPGCYGIQVDGTNFSDVITIKVTSVNG